MLLRTLLLFAALAVTLAAVGATAQPVEARAKVAVLKTKNRTPANRPIGSLDRIVVHTTEGSFWGSVRWLRSRKAHGSAHYVVSQKGEIVQLVSTSDVAWHAGDRRTNLRSIGIEHEGWAYERGTITAVQYEASARLVGWLVHRMGIPVDREHIIGHDEVPDPTGRGVGGAHHHTDPGPHWRWDHYLERIRHHAANPQKPRLVAPPPPHARVGTPIRNRPQAKRRAGGAAAPRAPERAVRCGFRPSIHSTTLYHRQTVSGIVPWQARACGRRLHRVDFLVDGKLMWSDRVRPFAFAPGRGWNTTALANGWHTLVMRAYGPNGHRVRRTLRVNVQNEPFTVELGGVAREQAVAGRLVLTAVSNAALKRAALLVGGVRVAGSAQDPFELELDTASFPDGELELELRAEAVDGRTAAATVPVLVANPARVPSSAPHVEWQSLSPWQSVSGPADWRALVSGDVWQVEFWVDGELRWTSRESPFAFGGPAGVWDTTAEQPGPRSLLVRAIGADGVVAEARTVVLVSPPAG